MLRIRNQRWKIADCLVVKMCLLLQMVVFNTSLIVWTISN